MIKLETGDLEGLKNLGSGKFGTVLRKDENTAYKLYHPTVAEDLTGIAVDNPALMLPKYHFHSLIRRSRKLIYSGGVLDLIYLNGKFEGVSIPFYDGDKLSNIVDSLSNKERIVISRQLIRNAKELNSHLIFPTDYKLNNIILSHNRAQLIDLDDSRTHVYYTPSLVCRAIGINALAETIQDMFNQFAHYSFKNSIGLKRYKSFHAFRYKKIEDYLDYREIDRKILFFSQDDNLETVKRLVNEYGFDAVYLVNKNDQYDKSVSDSKKLIQMQVPLFDVALDEMQNKYHRIENVKKAYSFDTNKRLVKTFERNK